MNYKNTSISRVLIVLILHVFCFSVYSQKTPTPAKKPATTAKPAAKPAAKAAAKPATKVTAATIGKHETMAANPNFKDPVILLEIADYRYSLKDYKEAEKYYTRLFKISDNQTEKTYLKYAQCLKKNKKDAEYKALMTKYNTNKKTVWKSKYKFGSITKGVVGKVGEKLGVDKNARNYTDEIKKNSGRYKIENFDAINTELSDYGGIDRDGTSILFTSTIARRKDLAGTVASHYTTEEKNTYYDIFKMNYNNPLKIKDFQIHELSFPYSISTPTLSADGNTIYFTRNMISKELKKDVLKIFRATLTGGKWHNVIEMPFNSSDFSYSVGHPFLTPDGQRLYFVSDKPGGYGKTDIYYVNVKGGSDYTFPINLGKKINSKGKESFPFESKKGDFYFSSDGHPGLGKLDVFVSRRNKNVFGEVYNVGAPVNSSSDDFCFFIDDATRKGYISSDRSGGKGSDDIYQITETKKLITVFK